MGVLPPVHIAPLAAFLFVTALLLASTSSGLRRADDVLLFWRDVRMQPLPFGPLVFLGLMALFLLADNLAALDIHPLLPAGYFFGGLLWLLASVLTPSTIITHHGFIVRTRRGRHRVAWRQVADYFQFKRRGRSGFVFLYDDRHGERKRVELTVPRRHRARFDTLLRRYVADRINRMPAKAFGDTWTNG